ncbi:MAG TPA: hypothetical protein VGT99_00620 [Gammaproteobacteria bacterium]|nr:hypothetical protein [Gammaproteobacteria bacterium]
MTHHWKGKGPLRWIAMGIMFAVFAAGAAFLFGYVAMSLWNWLMPDIFGLRTISYWQAFGLLVLSWIFFGRFRGGHWHRRGHRWRHRLAERWMQMTPEERERFKEEMQDWHHRHPGHE